MKWEAGMSTGWELPPKQERPQSERILLLGCSTMLFSLAFLVVAGGIWLLAQVSLAFGLVTP